MKKTILLIMDGWGKGQVSGADAIKAARTDFVDSLYNTYPHSELVTCGEAVGLPDGQMGNSEVGHLNLGAGRVVYQDLVRINKSVRDKSLGTNPGFEAAIHNAKNNGNRLHFIGLVSDGGVHSHIDHLIEMVNAAYSAGVKDIYIHAFTDGRDTDPNGAVNYMQKLELGIAGTSARVVSVIGRYYAMDRDKRWERVKLAYNLMVNGIGDTFDSSAAAVESSYSNGITDEFILPAIIGDAEISAASRIKNNDTVICFNFRTDRCREITEALTQSDFPDFDMFTIRDLYYVTMTEYDQTYKNVNILFNNDNLHNTLGEVLCMNGKKQIRIAETEKYPHVTFFFSGGREKEFEGEKRIICPSPKDVPTYDLKPEMSAWDITNAIIPEIISEDSDFICLNFANTDMVGHTGVWEAVIKAAETVNNCVEKIVPVALQHGYTIFLTADHGNADFMINEDGSVNTAHSLNPVPLFLISRDYKGPLRNGKLGDIAPTILHYMNIPVPQEMTGEILID